jgi:hypothetical protein
MQIFKAFSTSPTSKQSFIYVLSIEGGNLMPFDGWKTTGKAWLKMLILSLCLLSAACVAHPEPNHRDDSRANIGSSTYNPYGGGFEPSWPFGPAPQQ